MNIKTLGIVACLLLFQNLRAQIVSKNGWYFPKNPMTNAFGYPFVNVESKSKEAVVGAGNSLKIDSTSDLNVNRGFSYSKIFEESWKQIILGNLYTHSKKNQITVESWREKRWVLNRNQLKNFDDNTYYILEALSADTIHIICTISRATDADSKAVDDVLKKYIASQTVFFEALNALNKDKKDTIKGTVNFKSTDSSKFIIEINNPNVLYALKFGKITTRTIDYLVVQDGYKKAASIPFGNILKYPILNYTYRPKNTNPTNIYADLRKTTLADNNPTLFIYNFNENDTFEINHGTAIADHLLHFEGQGFYQKKHSGSETLKVYVCYDFDYDTDRKTISIKGKDKTGEYLNCIYEIRSNLQIYP